MEMSAVTELGKITLKPVEKGALKGTPDTTAGQSNSAPSLLSLFDLQIADGPVIIYVVRRPGCPLCREEAQGKISTLIGLLAIFANIIPF
jgi:hypothetical protein